MRIQMPEKRYVRQNLFSGPRDIAQRQRSNMTNVISRLPQQRLDEFIPSAAREIIPEPKVRDLKKVSPSGCENWWTLSYEIPRCARELFPSRYALGINSSRLCCARVF
jgi:hypothetical protein